APLTASAHVDLYAQLGPLGATRTVISGRAIIISEIELDWPLGAVGNIQRQTRGESLQIELGVDLFGEGKVSTLGAHTKRRALGEFGTFRRFDVDDQSS